MLEFRSIEEEQVAEIHRRQNGDCAQEVSALLDNDVPWSPMTQEQVRESIVDMMKKPRTSVFSVFSGGDLVGMGAYSSNWDTWCPWFHVIIWPEHRRKGLGTAAARKLIERSFRDNPAHSLDTGEPEWNHAAICFIRSLGFKEAGRIRLVGMKDGGYFDALMFDMLKSEWEAAQ